MSIFLSITTIQLYFVQCLSMILMSELIWYLIDILGSLYVYYVPYGWPNHWADCAQMFRTYSLKIRDQC